LLSTLITTGHLSIDDASVRRLRAQLRSAERTALRPLVLNQKFELLSISVPPDMEFHLQFPTMSAVFRS